MVCHSSHCSLHYVRTCVSVRSTLASTADGTPMVSYGFLGTACLCSQKGTYYLMLPDALQGECTCPLPTSSLFCILPLNAMPPLHYLTDFFKTPLEGSRFQIANMTPRNTPLPSLKNPKCLNNAILQHRKPFQKENNFTFFFKKQQHILLNSVVELYFFSKDNTVNVLNFFFTPTNQFPNLIKLYDYI